MTVTSNKALSPKQEIAILRRIAQIASLDLDLHAVLDEVVDIVGDLTEADSVFIYLLNGNRLILEASKLPHSQQIGHLILEIGEGLTGWVAEKSDIVHIAKNAYQDPRFKNFSVLPEDEFESFLSVPIIFQNRVIGVINAQNKKTKTHSQAIMDLISAIGSHVGGFIEHARLFNEMKFKMKQFECFCKIAESITSEPYLDNILKNIAALTAEMFDSKICSIVLLEEKKKRQLIVQATHSLSKAYELEAVSFDVNTSLSGEVLRSAKPRAVENVCDVENYALRELAQQEHLTSMLLVPMVIKNKPLGLVNVYTRKRHQFTQTEIDTLQLVAQQVAVTIENRKLMEETMKAKEALEVRKLIDRAKGILMTRHNYDEDTAYRLIHRKSMDSGRTMKEISEAIIITSDMEKENK